MLNYLFSPSEEVYTNFVYFLLTEKYHLTYKFVKTECKLVRSILSVHCFREVNNFDSSWHAQKETRILI